MRSGFGVGVAVEYLAGVEYRSAVECEVEHGIGHEYGVEYEVEGEIAGPSSCLRRRSTLSFATGLTPSR